MSLHRFCVVQDAPRHGLNLTETVWALHTWQPRMSKAILELQEDLGANIFVRHGKRLRPLSMEPFAQYPQVSCQPAYAGRRPVVHALVSLSSPQLTPAVIDAAMSPSPAEPN